MTTRSARTAFAAVIVLAAAACSTSTAKTGSDGATIRVDAGAKNCDLEVDRLAAGRHTFEVNNTASEVTEVYVYAAGGRIVGEVENVGPATTRKLIVDLAAGRYQVACKPGMVGYGNRTPLTVTGRAAPSNTADRDLQAAVASYRRYVESETRALVTTTQAFVARIAARDLRGAATAYPTARLHYERIEPIAESFGDLDPLIDMRIDDAGPGTTFVGFHALEQLLFQRKSLAGAQPLATALLANVGKLNTLVRTVAITPLVMGNGAKSLLDEVAKFKVTGEEERYSRIDLVDFAGNVEGARYAYTALRPALQKKDTTLVTVLDTRFRALIGLLGTHTAQAGRRGSVPGSPYVSYDALTASEVKALAVEVDAISEPLGTITGVVTSR